MSCAPFRNPLDNALSYLYTNKAIDADMNVTSNKINIYITVLEKQAQRKLFNIVGNKLEPITDAFNELLPDVEEETNEVTEEITTEANYVERMLENRNASAAIWNDSVVSIPTMYKENQEYITELFEKGILKLNCT